MYELNAFCNCYPMLKWQSSATQKNCFLHHCQLLRIYNESAYTLNQHMDVVQIKTNVGSLFLPPGEIYLTILYSTEFVWF